MKKYLAIYSVILLVIFALLSIMDRGSDYIVEKKIWALDQQRIEVAKDPKSVPSNAFDDIVSGYESLIADYPKSHLTWELPISIGEIYALRGDYDKAREVLLGVIKNQSENKGLAAEALYKIGETYEVEGLWDNAYQAYQSVIAKYPLTGVGLNMPIHIANHYKGENDFQAAMDAYETAILHYKSIARSEASSRPGLTAMRHLATCYLDQNRWGEAINTLGSIIEKYSTSDYLTVKDVDLIIKTINITSAYQLKDYDVAIALYEGIIDRNPGHPLNDYLNKVIDAFNQLKEQGIVVSEMN